jgi:hypothetical protein
MERRRISKHKTVKASLVRDRNMEEQHDLRLLAKAYYVLEGTHLLVKAIVNGENPNIDPYWALDELALKLKELASVFKKH